MSNLERCDLTVYWELCGQLRVQTNELAPGTPIRRIDVGGAEAG